MTLTEKCRELIVGWRKWVAGRSGHPAQRHAATICADQLEAALATPEPAASETDLELARSEFAILCRVVGNWREFPEDTIHKGENAPDWRSKDWKAALRAILERNELREQFAQLRAEMFDQFWDIAAAHYGVPAGQYTPATLIQAIAQAVRAEKDREADALIETFLPVLKWVDRYVIDSSTATEMYETCRACGRTTVWRDCKCYGIDHKSDCWVPRLKELKARIASVRAAHAQKAGQP